MPRSRTATLITLALLAALARDSLFQPANAQIYFPDDARVVDVTHPPYNAKGDGKSDDTAALNRALRDHNRVTAKYDHMPWTIYLPPGTYLVSDTIGPVNPTKQSEFVNGVRITGAGRDKTTIRLKDNARGFDRPRKPREVLRTGASPTNMLIRGRKSKGQPNSAYGNYVEHLTVDVGSGNDGAVGVRFDVANIGAMEHVSIVSSDKRHAGRYGLRFVGTAGPGYVHDLLVDGFDYGVHLDQTPVNNISFERIFLRNQRRAGIFNGGKIIGVLDLHSENAVPAVQLGSDFATAFLINADLRRTAGSKAQPPDAITGTGFIYLRDVTTPGYRAPVAASIPVGKAAPGYSSNRVTEWWSENAVGDAGTRSLRLPIHQAPAFQSDDPDAWVSVAQFGATPDDDSDDDADGIQKAIDSGKPIVYFPRGTYTIRRDIELRGNVRKLDLIFSRLISPKSDVALVVGDVRGHDVTVTNGSIRVPIRHESRADVVVKNIGGPSTFLTGTGASGDIYIENVGPHARVEVRNGLKAWIRSINREIQPLLNDGSTVWIFGDNVERMAQKATNGRRINAVRTQNGGKTEYVAGCLDALRVRHSPDDGALFVVEDATLSATYGGVVRRTRGNLTSTWGRWSVHVIEEQGTNSRSVTDSSTIYRGAESAHQRRFLVPLVSSASPESSAK